MHQIADVEVAKNIMDANKRLADKNLKNLEDKEIFCVDFVGAIGSGNLVGHGLHDLPLDDLDVVIIENVGNLICPVDFDLGSHLRIVVVSVTEGDDTVEKHPIIFQTSDVVVINKVDLADAVGADADKMVEDAKKLNPNVKVIKSSLKEGIGLDEIIKVIEENM